MSEWGWFTVGNIALSFTVAVIVIVQLFATSRGDDFND